MPTAGERGIASQTTTVAAAASTKLTTRLRPGLRSVSQPPANMPTAPVSPIASSTPGSRSAPMPATSAR